MRKIVVISLLLFQFIMIIIIYKGLIDISSNLDLSSATSAYIRVEANEERQKISVPVMPEDLEILKSLFKGTIVKAPSTYPFYSGVSIVFELEEKEIIFYLPDDFGIIYINKDDKPYQITLTDEENKKLEKMLKGYDIYVNIE